MKRKLNFSLCNAVRSKSNLVHLQKQRREIILLGNRSKEEILYETKGGVSATVQSVSVCKTRKIEGLAIIRDPILDVNKDYLQRF